MKKLQPYRPDYTPDESPWRATFGFHPNDDRLRFWGFKIHARPSNAPAVWLCPDRKLRTEAEALKLIEGGEHEEIEAHVTGEAA